MYLFWQLHSQHPSTNLLHFWIHKLPMHPPSKHWNYMDVFHCKRNKFVQTFLCFQLLNKFWLYWILGSTKMYPMEGKLKLLQLLCQTYQLHCPFSVYWLMSASQKTDNNSCCDNAYRRLFFYHWLGHGPAYTRNTDDRLVEPDCFMFL